MKRLIVGTLVLVSSVLGCAVGEPESSAPAASENEVGSTSQAMTGVKCASGYAGCIGQMTYTLLDIYHYCQPQSGGTTPSCRNQETWTNPCAWDSWDSVCRNRYVGDTFHLYMGSPLYECVADGTIGPSNVPIMCAMVRAQ